MEQVGSLLNLDAGTASTSDDWPQRYCDLQNSRYIPNSEYDCKLCGNKGKIFQVVDGEEKGIPCKCI